MRDYFGSEILALESDFLGSMKDAVFWVTKEKQRDFFGFRKKD